MIDQKDDIVDRDMWRALQRIATWTIAFPLWRYYLILDGDDKARFVPFLYRISTWPAQGNRP